MARKMMTVYRDEAEAAKHQAATAEAKYKAAVEGHQQFNPNRTPQQIQPPGQQSSTMAASNAEDFRGLLQQTVADSLRSIMPGIVGHMAQTIAQTKDEMTRQVQVTMAAHAEEQSNARKQGGRIRHALDDLKAFMTSPGSTPRPTTTTTTYTAAASGGSHGFLGGLYGSGTADASLGVAAGSGAFTGTGTGTGTGVSYGMADPRGNMAFAASHFGSPLGGTTIIPAKPFATQIPSRREARKHMRHEETGETMAFAATAQGTVPFRTEPDTKKRRGSFLHPAEQERPTSFYTGHETTPQEQALIDYLLPSRPT